MRIIFVLLIFLSGCTPNLMDKLPPDASFDLFEYHRGGGVSSASIVAKDGVRVGDAMEIGDLMIKGDYPFFNTTIHLKNYHQDNN